VQNNPKLSVLGGDYEFTLQVSGTWQGIDCTYIPSDLLMVYAKILNFESFEVSEFSLSNFTMMRDKNINNMVAIPVFVNRAFRHGIMWVKKESDITEPSQLKGLKVGIRDYSMTAAVWLRGTLLDEYGVHWSDIDWYANKIQRFPAPERANLSLLDKDPEEMLLNNELDVYIDPRPKDLKKPLNERKLRPLLNNVQETEKNYYLRTGIYPINHCVVIHKDTYEKISNVAPAIFEAYSYSKKIALQRKIGSTLIPWGSRNWPEIMSTFNDDPFPFGLNKSNMNNVGTLLKYLFEQELISKKPGIEELFLKESLDW
jgi:4,5-dihydroxyphthalate decarboxylase